MQTTAITQNELKNTFQGETELKDLIKHYEAIFWEQGEVICQIKVNGLALSEKDEVKFQHSKIADIQSLEIATQTTQKLISETLDSILQMLPIFQKYCEAAASDFRQEGQAGVHHTLTKIVDNCDYLTNALGLLKQVIVNLADNENFAIQWEDTELKFYSSIQNVLKAFESSDYILVGDLLEYELSPALNSWYNLLRTEENIFNRSSN